MFQIETQTYRSFSLPNCILFKLEGTLLFQKKRNRLIYTIPKSKYSFLVELSAGIQQLVVYKDAYVPLDLGQ